MNMRHHVQVSRIMQRCARKYFVVSPQIANPEILRLIPQWQIPKFLRCARPHKKSQIQKFVMIKPQVANLQIAPFAEGPQIFCGPPTFVIISRRGVNSYLH